MPGEYSLTLGHKMQKIVIVKLKKGILRGRKKVFKMKNFELSRVGRLFETRKN